MLTEAQIEDLADIIAKFSLVSEEVKAEMESGSALQALGWEERRKGWEERLKELIARLLKFAQDVGPDNVTVSVKPFGTGLDMTWALKRPGG